MQRILCTLVSITFAILAGPTAASMLDDVRERGVLRCGVASDLPGFSALNEQGLRLGFDVDLCRAVAAAVVGDGFKVSFTLLSSAERVEAITEDRVDFVAYGVAQTLAVDAGAGVAFTPVLFYDGQAVITRRETGVRSVRDLSGGSVCVARGTSGDQHLSDYISSQRLRIARVRFDDTEQAWDAYLARRCDSFSGTSSTLAGLRTQLDAPADHLVLPEILSKEPIAGVVPADDLQWQRIVRWVVYGLIEAEERGVTAGNVRSAGDDTDDRQILRMLGERDDLGALLGLDAQWLVRAIETSGNYGEIFDRNVGSRSGLRLRRGLNDLWTRGGLMYAPPLR